MYQDHFNILLFFCLYNQSNMQKIMLGARPRFQDHTTTVQPDFTQHPCQQCVVKQTNHTLLAVVRVTICTLLAVVRVTICTHRAVVRVTICTHLNVVTVTI